MRPWENFSQTWRKTSWHCPLWKRVLACIKRLLEVFCEHLGVTVDEMTESLFNDEEAASAYLIMAKALENRENEKEVA